MTAASAFAPATILEQFDLRHLVAEALAATFADNSAFFGDPDLVGSPVLGLASAGLARACGQPA